MFELGPALEQKRYPRLSPRLQSVLFWSPASPFWISRPRLALGTVEKRGHCCVRTIHVPHPREERLQRRDLNDAVKRDPLEVGMAVAERVRELARQAFSLAGLCATLERTRVQMGCRRQREKRQGLSIQPRESHDAPQAFAARKVEANDLIAGHTIEVSIGSKTQAARFAELSLPIWKENTDEMPVGRIVLPNSCEGVQRAEWMLAGDDDIAIGRDCEIERTQFRICHQPRRLRKSAWSESDYGVIALAVRADS
jgi:hypothetical protein